MVSVISFKILDNWLSLITLVIFSMNFFFLIFFSEYICLRKSIKLVPEVVGVSGVFQQCKNIACPAYGAPTLL